MVPETIRRRALEARGVTRRERRQRAILAAARDLFLAKGYERTTIGDILAVSGGSRTTLMDIFGGKEGLFISVMEDVSREVEATFRDLDASDAPPETALRAFAHQFLSVILQPRTLSLLRILAAEGERFPEISGAFFRLGPKTGDMLLAAYLRRCIANGHLRPGDPTSMSQVFRGMIVGDVEMRAIIGNRPNPSAEESRAHVDNAVNIFLKGVGL